VNRHSDMSFTGTGVILAHYLTSTITSHIKIICQMFLIGVYCWVSSVHIWGMDAPVWQNVLNMSVSFIIYFAFLLITF